MTEQQDKERMRMPLRIETSRFGTLDVDESTVITFTQPILGFPERRRFVLLPGPENSALLWLQSTEDGALAFIVMDPRTVMAEYAVPLRQGELAELAVTAADQLDIYTIVVVPEDRTQIRTNLKAPILINPALRLGKQTVLESSDYPVQYFLSRAREGGSGSGGAQEVSHARSDA